MQPLKLMRQRSYALAPDQVFNLSSVQVESPSYSMGKPAPSSLSRCSAYAPTIADEDSVSSQWAQRWMFMWRQRVEDCLWVASAFFILYYGDFRSDFFTVLANDDRVLRMPFHMGLVCLMVDTCMVMLYMASPQQQEEEEEERSRQLLLATGVIQAIAMLGSMAFILLSLALWPIWNFLTIPMLFTLFMAVTVVLPYVLPPDVKILKLDLGCAT